MKNHPLASLGMLAVVLMALVLAAPASADGEGNVLRVGPGQDYESIQAAVYDAQQGSRILVYPRIDEEPEEYVESVKIRTNNLQIIAQGSDVTVNPPEGKPGFDVNADHVTVRGFDISGAVCANGILFQGSHNTFAENKIHGFADPCDTALIRCHDEDGGSDYNTIESNSLSAWGIATGSYGIYVVAAGSDALNEGNVIKNNTIVSLQGPGIYVSNGTGFQISGNYLENTFFHEGILIEAMNNEPQGNHRVLKNTMWYPSAAGISLSALPGTVLAHNHISDNKIMESGGDCIALKAAGEGASLVYNRVISNEVVGSIGLNGIHLFADQDAAVNDNLIIGNTVSGNHEDGILLSAGSDHNKILKNNVTANSKNGIEVAGDNNLIVGNYVWDIQVDHDALVDEGEGNIWRNNSNDAPPWGQPHGNKPVE